MRISAKQAVLAAIVAGLGVGATVAHAATPGIDPNGTVAYLVDKDFNVVKSGTGLCWQNGYWTPANAIAECDGTAKGAPAGAKITLAADTLFAFNKADLKPEGKKALDNVVEQAKALKVEVIVAVGYTDRIGSDAYNLKLSQKRAASVKSYLVTKGIPADKIYTEGKGKANPVTGTTCNKIGGPQDGSNKKLVDCLQPDRRAVLEIIGTK
ncbi:MAG: OmpA family protein [Rhodocyclaceae bacterium]|jgi:OOP family OmpA-OmpF porin|nr:OmpA family protein [Rhodocyclaceae bacterium]